MKKVHGVGVMNAFNSGLEVFVSTRLADTQEQDGKMAYDTYWCCHDLIVDRLIKFK